MTDMKSLKTLAFGLSVMTLAAACQKSGTTDLASTEVVAGLGRCTSSKAVDPSLLRIEGAKYAKAGEDVAFHLNQDLSCSTTQKVSWQATGADEAKPEGSSVVSSYAAAGSYVVSAKIASASSEISAKPSVTELYQKTVVVSNQPGISGPEIMTIGEPGQFSLVLPNGYVLASAIWNFGDGTPTRAATSAIDHTFNRLGLFKVTLTTTNSAGEASSISMNVNVLDNYDGLECVINTTMSSPADAVVGVPVNVSAHVPSCLAPYVTSIAWSFGDGGVGSSTSAQHTYNAVGDYEITLQVFTKFKAGPFLTLTRDIHIDEALPEIPPPNPSPSPTPTPHPLSCPAEGQTRESMNDDTYTEEAACGLNGRKKQIFKTRIVEACQVRDNNLLWTEVSRTPVLQSEGPCEGQSCRLPSGEIMADGESRAFYSSQNPDAQCSTVSQARTCTNGVLGGSESYSQLSCHNACPGFGPHGMVRTGVVTGEEQVALICSFGEQGYYDIFNQISDQTCSDGSVIGSNTRRGVIKTAGSCPTYTWVGTDSWTACNADCGGQQNRVFECRNHKGEVTTADRCSAAAPVEARVCDANPSAVARVDRVSTEQEAGSTGTCPANQIGVIVQKRTATSVKAYACVNHAVSLVSDTMEYTPWVKESYCRDYTAYRCSNDSLDNSQARGRYEWMVKCQDQVPAIKEFLIEFENVHKGSYSIDEGSRRLYPTFMNRATVPEKTWVAPKSSSGSCTVPSTAYVAAVCLSSCATPDQEIIAQAKENLRLKSVPFVDALLQKYAGVATLKSGAKMSSRDLRVTKVEQWVTELVDGEHEILNFKMRSGGSLRLTPNHPVVAQDGSIKLASNFAPGESLVKFGGQLDEIVSIETSVHYGKVYNVFVQSNDLQQNIVVTGGYLNGTAFYQNEGAEYVNRQILRNKLTRGVFQ